jgi:hypothetical protein
VTIQDHEARELLDMAIAERDAALSKLASALEDAEKWKQLAIDNYNDAAEVESSLHQLSEDHSHCEDLLHELGARASSAESRLAEQLKINEQHARDILSQGDELERLESRLDSAESELRSARYVLGAFCKANGGEAYISRHTLAALSPTDEVERRDEPDGGIYYRLVETSVSKSGISPETEAAFDATSEKYAKALKRLAGLESVERQCSIAGCGKPVKGLVGATKCHEHVLADFNSLGE